MSEVALTLAVCTYNRSGRLPALVRECRGQDCPVPFEVLIINNNSQDDTLAVLERLQSEPGSPLRVVTETQQGIVPARNRAIAEAMNSEYLVFIDDDELPRAGFLAAAANGFLTHPDVICIGGRVKVDFTEVDRPAWLIDDLLGFLAETDYGDLEFSVKDGATPLWTANIGYRMSLFRDNPDLRFDYRFDRVGKKIGGGSDAIMFGELLRRGVPIRYCPHMIVDHSVEPWRLHRSYFLKLHFKTGFREARWAWGGHKSEWLGVPRFLFGQLLRELGRTFKTLSLKQPGISLRQAMTAAYHVGMIVGCHERWRESRSRVSMPS